MKIYYALLFGISVVIGVFCYWNSITHEYRLQKPTSNLIGVSGMTAMIYMISMLTDSYTVMKASHCVYFSIMGWLCTALLFYAVFFTGNIVNWKRMLTVLIPVLCLDTLSQSLNFWFDHSVTLKESVIDGNVYLVMEPHFPFYLHMALCYALVAGSFILFLYRIFTSARIYRVQYITVLALLVALVAGNAVFLVKQLPVDLSVIGYSICAWILYYYTRYYMTRQLTLRMSGILLDHMEPAVILFDRYGQMVYYNGKELLHQLPDITELDRAAESLKISRARLENGFRKEVTWSQGDVPRIFDVEYSLLYENDNSREQKIGSYFQIEDITKKREKLVRREYLASHDALTELYNRGYFCEQARQLITDHPEEEYAVLMTDLSQFKIYNEIFGTEAGDTLLKGIAEAIRMEMQGKQVVYGHYEADRFVICLPYDWCTEERIQSRKFSRDINNTGFRLNCYIGVCKVTDREEDIAVLCERAAIAVNTIKGDASRRVAFYDSEMKNSVLWEQELTAAFPKALKNGEIVPYIQPQFNQKTGELIGGEVLARWITNEGEMISPGRFIPVLEKNGQVTKMDIFIWERACRLAAEFLDNGKPVALSVNISGQDFFRCDVAGTFMELVNKYDLPPEYLRLEITESEMIMDMEKSVALIEELKSHGFIVEMDDFGSGYSSLNTLKDIPVDVLKMDMMFFRKRGYQTSDDNMEKGKRIIRNVIRMAEDLEIPVIAEGVETKEQAEFLADIGCNFIQGFLYGKPMPAEEFEALRTGKNYGKMV